MFPADPMEHKGLVTGLRRLFRWFSRRRRVQLSLVFGLMIIGALAELLAIGAILPFLSLIADPAAAVDIPVLGLLLAGMTPAGGSLLHAATTFFVLAAILAGLVRLLLAWLSQKFVFRVSHDIGRDLYARALYQPYSYHISRNSSALLADMDKVHAVALSVLLPLMNAATSLVIAIFILSALVAINPAVALASAGGFGLIYLVVSLLFRRRLHRNSRIVATAQTARIKTLRDGISAIRDVLIDRAQPVYVQRFIAIDRRYREVQAENAFLGAAPRYVIEASGMILIALVAMALANGPGGIAAALPVLGALALGAVRLLPLLQLIYVGWTQITSNRQSLFDVVTALELPLPPAQPKPVAALPFATRIAFENVGYSYPAGNGPVLRGITLDVPRGTRVGIMGKTGSGKSTLMDLLLGLLAPEEGRILVDGVALTPETTPRWQARIAHVPQSIYLSDSPVTENIAFGLAPGEIDMNRVRRAARQAALADFIESLPQGYDTFVGERGVRLSGGQRQRIGIARALYRQADVLVFDEATSALDSETEAAVMEAVGGLSRDLTIFMIAHRVSTLEGCDMVVDMAAGSAVLRKHVTGSRA